MIVNNKTIVITDPCYLSDEVDYDETDEYTRMDKLGFTNYICEPTLVGDWSCKTYKISEKPKDWLNNTESDYNIEIGRFCADSGTLFVGLLDEVLRLNPNFNSWASSHKLCVTIIPDFTGTISIYDINDDERHIIGEGNINFVTV